MNCVRRAVIDVGTNSVKLLVAEVEGRAVRPLWEDGAQTRLGEGFYKTHWLQPLAIQRTAQAVATFVRKAREHGAESVRVIATSAARDAVNPEELRQAVEAQSGLKMEIIPGELEAEWAYLGVHTDPVFAVHRLLIMDAGGGSTEFILGEGDQRIIQTSAPVGALRLMERFKPSDPPQPAQLRECRDWLDNFMRQHVQPALATALTHDRERTCLVGTGGTATILARMEAAFDNYDRARIESTRLPAQSVTRWVDHLWALPLAERKRTIGLPPARADLILTGAAIYEAVLRQFAFAELRISTRGLRFAAVLQPDRETTS